MATQIITKRCTKCKQIKPLSEFHKNCRAKDGHQVGCKVCNCKQMREYRQTERGRESHRIESAIYGQTEKGKATQCRAKKRDYLRYPKKMKARNAIVHAVAAGKLPSAKTLKCVYCGKEAKQYHHWKDYEPEHWFDIVPVCRKCHRDIHKSIIRKGLGSPVHVKAVETGDRY